MIWVRSILLYVAIAIALIPHSMAILLFGWFLPVRYTSVITQSWARTNAWLERLICGLKVQVAGQEHLATTPCILMVKHQSAWETISLHHWLPTPQAWVLKRSLLWIPFLGWVLKVGPSIPIDRTAGRRAILHLIRAGSDYLQAGHNIVLFPEGTRTAPGARQPYNIGGALLAQKTGYPIVPIAHNAGVYWARSSLKKYPGTIQMRIGPPIDPNGKTAKQILAAAEGWIEDTMTTLPQTRSMINNHN